MQLVDKYPVKNPKTAWRNIEGETLVVTPVDSMIHHLNPVGARCWQLCNGKRKVKDIIGEICQEFEVSHDTASKDITDFLQELATKEVLNLKEIPSEVEA